MFCNVSFYGGYMCTVYICNLNLCSKLFPSLTSKKKVLFFLLVYMCRYITYIHTQAYISIYKYCIIVMTRHMCNQIKTRNTTTFVSSFCFHLSFMDFITDSEKKLLLLDIYCKQPIYVILSIATYIAVHTNYTLFYSDVSFPFFFCVGIYKSI